MARPKKIFRTPDELAEMNRIRRNRSYEKNKEKEQKKSLERYYEDKYKPTNILTDGHKPFSFGGSPNINKNYNDKA